MSAASRSLQSGAQVIKKVLRTLQVHFPFMLDAKFGVMRFWRNFFRIPFEKDFNALSLFPATGVLYLDVGANRGQSTDAILMKHGAARIHLFEPSELLSGKLKRLYSGNCAVVVHDFGLGDENVEGVLYTPVYGKWMFDGLASFDRRAAMDWLPARILFYDETRLTIRESRCRIRRLDELNLAPFLIKIDVQGFEYQVLEGGKETIAAHQPVLLIETPNAKVMNFLKELTYDFFAYRDGKFRRSEKGALNTFFMTEEKSRLVERHIEPRLAGRSLA